MIRQHPFRVLASAFAAGVAVGLALTGCASRPPTSASTSPAALGMQREQIGSDYLWVPTSADSGGTPRMQVAGTAFGVVVALPPGYAALPTSARPEAAWTIYLSHPTAARQDLMRTATMVASLPRGQSDVTLMGVTGRYAVFAARAAGGRLLELVTLAGAGRGARRGVGAVTSAFAGALAIRGMVIYLGPHGTVHALHLATGRRASAGGVAPGPLYWSQGGLMVGARAVRLPGVDATSQAPLPRGFRWISTGAAAPGVIAVPQGYIVQQLPGESSHGVRATDPRAASIEVTVWENACAGCYNPGFLAQGVNTLSTPIYTGRHAGLTPIGDHGYIAETRQGQGLLRYTRVAYDVSGGDLEASVTVPVAQAALARRILATLRLPW